MTDYTLIRSRRRRRSLSLRVTHAGEIIVRAPSHTPKFFINNFVNSKQDWILKMRKKVWRNPPPHRLTPALATRYTKELVAYLAHRLPELAILTKTKYKQIKVKNVTSYWGLCTPHNDLYFNCTLAKFSEEVIDYVIIHELCHTRVKGHGKKFWSLVAKHSPDYQKHKQSLRKYSNIALD